MGFIHVKPFYFINLFFFISVLTYVVCMDPTPIVKNSIQGPKPLEIVGNLYGSNTHTLENYLSNFRKNRALNFA
jgi:hypothetical protein